MQVGDRFAVGQVAAIARDYRQVTPNGLPMATLLVLRDIPMRLHVNDVAVTAEAHSLVAAIKGGEIGLESA